MAWSYSGDPESSVKDAIRFEIGDTENHHQLLQDEEIEYAFAQEGEFYGAAARCCEVIARKLSKQADFRLGSQAVQASQRAQAYAQLAKELRSRQTVAASEIYYGSIDLLGKLKDMKFEPAAFKRNLMSNNDEEE